ncbi:MAG: hypothetical protein ABI865_10260 [Nitrosospira sp.]
MQFTSPIWPMRPSTALPQTGSGWRIGIHLYAVRITRGASPSWLRSKFGVVMECTIYKLHRMSCLALEELANAKETDHFLPIVWATRSCLA